MPACLHAYTLPLRNSLQALGTPQHCAGSRAYHEEGLALPPYSIVAMVLPRTPCKPPSSSHASLGLLGPWDAGACAFDSEREWGRVYVTRSPFREQGDRASWETAARSHGVEPAAFGRISALSRW